MLSNADGETTSHLQGMFYRTVRMLEAGLQVEARNAMSEGTSRGIWCLLVCEHVMVSLKPWPA